MTLRPLIVFLLLANVAVVAQEVPRTSTAVVPIVGSVFGATMVRWKTDVELVNDTGGSADVALELPSAPEQPVILLSLAPGESVRFDDIAGEAFGLEAVLSPLRVTTSGRRSITVRANVYADRGTERSPLQPITTYVAPQYAPLRVLDGLGFSEQLRTNIGLVNFSEREAEFVLALQRIPGRNLAVTRMRVSAGSLVHASIQSLFPLITEGTGFSVVIESAAPDTYVYASVIESANHAARFVAPRLAVR
jgi:hypothetical protein